jgi:DNA-binding NtrC family response regulator
VEESGESRWLHGVPAATPGNVRKSPQRLEKILMTALPSLRILVVDDEMLLRWSLCEVLRRHGHSVLEAASAGTCRDAMNDTPEAIDVVLLDYRLPDSRGLDLLREVRTRMPGAAVVLMTAFGSPEVVHDAHELGAYCVMTKPFDMDAVDHLVRSAHQGTRPR